MVRFIVDLAAGEKEVEVGQVDVGLVTEWVQEVGAGVGKLATEDLELEFVWGERNLTWKFSK